MKITIFNLKGGQGKTTLSLALATLYDCYIVTNDEYSPIDEVLEKGKTKHLEQDEELPSVPDEINLIYDFGGRPDTRVLAAARSSDFVLVPVFYKSPLDMQTTINAIREIEQHNPNIIIVVNMAQKDSLAQASEVLSQFFDYPIFEVKESTAFIRMIDQRKSIRKLMEDSFLFGYHYKKPLEQIEAIADYMFKDK